MIEKPVEDVLGLDQLSWLFSADNFIEASSPSCNTLLLDIIDYAALSVSAPHLENLAVTQKHY